MSEKKLYRNTKNKVIGGVCSGLAEYMNIDLTIVRLVVVLLGLFGSLGFWAYVIMWIVVPEKPTSEEPVVVEPKE